MAKKKKQANMWNKAVLGLLEDEFEEGSSENRQGETFSHNTLYFLVVLIITAVLIRRH